MRHDRASRDLMSKIDPLEGCEIAPSTRGDSDHDKVRMTNRHRTEVIPGLLGPWTAASKLSSPTFSVL
jgi:hypothetical protein